MPESRRPSPSHRAAPSRRTTAATVMGGVLVALLATAIVVQLRQDNASEDYTGVRGVELVELLKSLEATNDRLQQQIDELTLQRDELRSSNASTEEAEKAARERAAALAVLAGTAAARGPGVTVSIAADPGAVTAVVLLNAINELRDAGAEAIMLNGSVRVVASTYLLDDDDGVRVSGRLIQSPFVFDVIGAPATLDEAMRFRGGLIDQVEARGGTVTIVEQRSIDITALADPIDPAHATAE